MASIRKREWVSPSGKKQTRWQVDFRDGLGRRRAKQFRTMAEARGWIEGHDLHSVQTSTLRRTLSYASQSWLDRGESEGLERSTLESYGRCVRLHIEPHIGHLPLERVTAEHVIDFRKSLAKTKGVATARTAVHNLKMILAYAVRCGWTSGNVALGMRSAKAPRHQKAERIKNVRVISPEQLRDILKACARHTGGGQPRMRERTYALILTLAEGALRPSEARGLPWRDVLLDEGVIRIRQRADAWGTIGACKTDAAYREVPASPQLIKALTEWKNNCPASDDDLVFPTSGGRPLLQRNIIREFNKLQIAAGLWRLQTGADGKQRRKGLFKVYDLRHTRASWWIFEGLDLKTLTTRMGHSSIQVTFDTYGHLITGTRGKPNRSFLEELYDEATDSQHGAGASKKDTVESVPCTL